MPTNAFNFGPILDQTLANTKTILLKLAAMEKKMAEDFTALDQAVSDLKDEVMAIGDQMDKLFADLNAALGSGNQAAVDDATAKIQAQIDALKAAASRDMPPATP
jgi:Na+/phosphate symporter